MDGGLIVGPALERTPHAVALFTRYPVRWGHVLIVLRSHVTRFSDVSDAAWTDATLLARRAASALERALDPVRCYVASLGASEAELWVTSPHLHLHVVPVYDRDDRPRGVLTWEHGVYEADAEEWTDLERRVRAAW